MAKNSEKLPTKEQFLKDFSIFYSQLHDESFYGKITIEIRNGQVYLVRKEQSLKFSDNIWKTGE